MIRILVLGLLNLLLAPRNLLRALGRRPRWIRVRLAGAVPEQPPRRRLWRRSRTVSMATLAQLTRALERDRHVVGVLLEIEPLEVGWARLESLRGVIAAWRRAGKRVVAHLSSPGNREYFLACACDEILADESGPLALTGLLIESGFYGEALRRLGVDAELDRIGEYKSYADTFTRSDMAPPHREALEAILDGLERLLVGAISAGRRVDEATARTLMGDGPYLAERAHELGLLDGVLYRDELMRRLDVPPEQVARLDRYLAARPRWFSLAPRRRVVAVVDLEGTIVPGEGSDVVVKSCGAASAGRALAGLERDPRIGAVVLHVDSRGGSAAASDLLWRRVEQLAAHKPVVAYLGDAAASGGYYLVAPAHWIVAQRSTLTGSIGVVAGKIAVERALDQWGVGTVLLTRGRAAAMMSPRQRYDEEGRTRLRAELEATYRRFVAKVARGRRRTEAEIDAVARGRVWLGEDAATRGLVDELGGLDEAIAAARKRAERRPGERFAVRFVAPRPHPEGRGWMSMLGAAQRVREELATWRALLGERVLLVDLGLPDVR